MAILDASTLFRRQGPGTSPLRTAPWLQHYWMISGTLRMDQPNGKHRCLIFEAMGPDMASMTDTNIEDL